MEPNIDGAISVHKKKILLEKTLSYENEVKIFDRSLFAFNKQFYLTKDVIFA